MARNPSKKDPVQLGFDMEMILPKLQPAPKGNDAAQPAIDVRKHRASTGSAHPSDADFETNKGPTPNDQCSILSVGELTRQITELLEKGIGLIWVEGEISNLRTQASGHSYFTLKDETSQLSCVLFARTATGQSKTALRDGLQVQLHGQISVYQPRGQYQLVVRLVQPRGEGALQARFEELKRRLATEGLFDQERKRPLPRFPRRIGVVTSPTGAAIRDFLNVLHRRHPGLHVVINPVHVQGKGAATEIAAAITEFSSASALIGSTDVIVVTRGGGSLEDLWEFNEEIVARAIAGSTIPVVSAVGHEIDFSIADFVADLRAPTPSAAAELLAADGAELIERCRTLVGRISRETRVLLERHRAQNLRLADSSLFRESIRRLDEIRQTCDRTEDALSEAAEQRLERLFASLATLTARIATSNPVQQLGRTRQKVVTLAGTLHHHVIRRFERDQARLRRIQTALATLSPEATLARGFSITRNSKGKVVTSSVQVEKGEELHTRLADGEIGSVIITPR